MTDQQKLGKYIVMEKLGSGGFATVYRAEDTTLGREVALKVLDPLLMRDTAWVERFRHEARAVAKLEHPAIVTVYEIAEADGRLFIAMKLIRGPSLDVALAERGAYPWEEAQRLMEQVTGALVYAHGQGILHRDLKPGNILLDAQAGAVLTDFGFARLVSESSMSLSLSGGMVGTPSYIAPELWHNRAAVVPSDLYALGCILYELLTGRKAFSGATPPAVMMAHFQPLVLPKTWPEGTPPGVADVLRRALAPEPGDRYASASEFLAALDALQVDPLAEPYTALQAAMAAGDWDAALRLAEDLHAQQPNYRDVATLAQQAQAGWEQAQRIQAAAQWKEQAQAAMQGGQTAMAQAALAQWLKLTPEDAAAQRLQQQLAATGEETARKQREAEETARKQREAEETARKQREAEEAARKQREAEETARKQREAEETARKQREAEAAARKQREAEETVRKQREAEEAARKQREAEETARKQQEAERERLAEPARPPARASLSPSAVAPAPAVASLQTVPRIPMWVWPMLAVVGVLGVGGWAISSLMARPVPTPIPTATRMLASMTQPTWTPEPAATATPASTPTRRPSTSTPPPAPKLDDTWTRPADGMVQVYVPAGEFQMGSNDGDDDEKPVHTVRLDAFWIDQTEVTNAQYEKCVQAGACNASYLKDDATCNGAMQPVVGVDWNDAAAYCAWAGAALPTEAQWEYAARGPENRVYPWGNEWQEKLANCIESECKDGYEGTVPVGSFPAGASWVGALDLAGNVWEWTGDWYGKYPSSRQNNPQGPASGEYRTWRGGAWSVPSWALRTACRLCYPRNSRLDDVGFRCIRGVQE